MITFKLTFLLAFNKSLLETPKKRGKSPRRGKKSSRSRSRGRKSDKRSKKSGKVSKKTGKESKKTGKISKKSGKGSTKSKKSKGSKRSKRSAKQTKSDEENEKKDEIKVKKPLSCLHVEYNLFPNKEKSSIDIICWGPVVTIYSGSHSKSFRTFYRGNLIWAPVYLEHNLNEIETSEVKALKDHFVILNLKFGKKKLGKKAQSDKTSVFYLLEGDEEKENDIVEVYSTKPDPKAFQENSDNLYNDMKNIILECIYRPTGGEITTDIQRAFNKVHKYKVVKTLKKLEENKDLNIISVCRRTDEEGVKSKKGKPGKSPKSPKSKKSKKSTKTSTKASKKSSSRSKKKSLKANPFMYKFPGEIFITNPEFSLHKLPQSSALENGFIFITVNKLLKIETKFELVPLIVKILKINNLPDQELVQKGYQSVWFNCEIPGVGQFRTCNQDIKKTIKVNEARCIWAKAVPKLKLIELLQTQRVYIEVWGERVIERPPKESTTPKGGRIKSGKSSKKGKSKKSSSTKGSKSKKTKSGKSKKSKGKSSKKSKSSKGSKQSSAPVETTPNLIAVATFDVTSLLQCLWLFKEETQCHHPGVLLTEKFDENLKRYITDKLTVNEINFDFNYKSPENYPINEATLTTLNTTIKLEMYFLAPHYATLRVQHITDSYYRRLLLIVFDKGMADFLINEIIIHNQETVGVEVLNTNYSDCLITKGINNNVVSGFLIDNNTEIIFYIEGIHNGLVLHLYQKLEKLNLNMAKVFYSSDYLFEKRLYPDFKFLGGFFIIVLKCPLQNLFQRRELYMRGNVPIPCWKAITKLNLLVNTQTFKTILQLNLLPSSKELISLGTEFGLPLVWHKEKDRGSLSFGGTSGSYDF